MEVERDTQTPTQSEPTSEEADAAEEREEQTEEEYENEVLMSKARALIDRIVATHENPNPNALHALATILGTEKSSYMEDTVLSSTNNGRSARNVGRLVNLIRQNDEFFILISSKFLTESRYSVSVQASAMRLLFCCSITWMYPHVFEDDVVENVRGWVIHEIPRSSVEECNLKQETGRVKTVDSEMLRTYSTGLLAVCLACGGQLVQDVLTTDLPAKLMQYLRIRVLGKTNSSKKDSNPLIENKSVSTMVCLKTREENRSRLRNVTESSDLDLVVLKKHTSEGDSGRDLVSLDETERDHDMHVNGQVYEDDFWVDEKPSDSLAVEDACEAEGDGDKKCNSSDSRKPKLEPVGKSHVVVDFDENVRDDRYKRGTSCRSPRVRGKSQSSEGVSKNEQALTSLCSGSSSGHAWRMDRSVIQSQCFRRISEAKRGQDISDADDSMLERADNNDCFQECDIQSKNITDMVKQAVRAAEAEAKVSDAPAVAIKAAGDDTAKVVKTAAFEEYRKTNDEEVLVVAAARALSTVINAANAVSLSRTTTYVDDDSGQSKPTETKVNEDIGKYVILDGDSLAKLREKFCIQCLVILGEYVEALCPVLNDKGVDVTLALLQRCLEQKEASIDVLLLNDILKLISVLAAHGKFAASFVRCGGFKRLLAVPRSVPTYAGLSSCLLTIGSVKGIMRCIRAYYDVVPKVVELALQLLKCRQDQSRKNATLFFATAFVFREVIYLFDVRHGLERLIDLLNDAAYQLNNHGSLRNDRSPSDVLTSSQMQVAYHACVALRQYFRAHLLLHLYSVDPTNSIRITSAMPGYKHLDTSNEAMDAVLHEVQKNRKLGRAFVRAQWFVVDSFIDLNGHITMLELCQAFSVERYSHNLLQYALGVLHIVTLVPDSHKFIVNARLSNGRAGIAVILDATNGAGYAEPEIVEPALNLLINLVSPPPSIRNKVSATKASASIRTSQFDIDRRIPLGAGAVWAGLAAKLEQGYHQAREVVYANNGIKVLLQLLQPQMVTSPAAFNCLRALTCQVLLGLAEDETIAYILTKLQVGKKLSEFIRDSGSQSAVGEHNWWQAELARVANALIRVLTNSRCANTLTARAATPTVRCTERGAMAAATPISSHSRELLLILEHLQTSGLAQTATTLFKEIQSTPLPSLDAPSSLSHQGFGQEASSLQIQWPSGRTTCGFLSDKKKVRYLPEDSSLRCDSAVSSLKTKPLALGHSKVLPKVDDSLVSSTIKNNFSFRKSSIAADIPGITSVSDMKSVGNVDFQTKTPYVLPMKRILTDLKDNGLVSSGKRLNTGEHLLSSPSFTPLNIACRSGLQPCASLFCTPVLPPMACHIPNVLSADINESKCTWSQVGQILSSQHTLLNGSQPCASERVTLDSLVAQYLGPQQCQFSDPITTLPPLSLLRPHVCPQPRQSLDAPSNVTARLSTREFRSMYGGIHRSRKDRQFVYSRFRRWRTCRDDTSSLQTCISFLGDSSRIVIGGRSGELKVFGSNSNSVLDSCTSHQSSLTLLQSRLVGINQLVLSSTAKDVCLWDASSISGGPKYSFDGIKAARFSNLGSIFSALGSDPTRREIHLYDVQTCQLDIMLSDTASSTTSGRNHAYSLVHFSPSDSMLLWNGVLWDRRSSEPIHRFDQFTDYNGGGFHPTGNQVIVNSKVLDLRNLRLLRSVPSLDQTFIMFNASGDVIYGIPRRNLEDFNSTYINRRGKHCLLSAFRTVDAVDYSDIATIHVGRRILDFATEPTDSFLGLITIDDKEKVYSSSRVYEIGRHQPTDIDSDADDAKSEDKGVDVDSDSDDCDDDNGQSEFVDGEELMMNI